jgi:hypothetical protein
LAIALNTGICLANAEVNQSAGKFRGEDGGESKSPADYQHGGKAPVQTNNTDKAGSKGKVDAHPNSGNENPDSNKDKTPKDQSALVRTKVKTAVKSPRPGGKSVPVSTAAHYPSMMHSDLPARLLPDGMKSLKMKKVEKNPAPLEGAAPPSKAAEQPPHFVPSRVQSTASIGELTSASVKTSAGAINGTGMKHRP